MLFWTIILVLTAAAVMSILLPLGRAPKAQASDAARDRAVYLDQLAELERDRAEGRVTAEEAEAARVEIARRLLALERETGTEARNRGGLAARRTAAVLALVGVPVLSMGLYLTLGTPSLPGQPLAARLSAPEAGNDYLVLIRRVEEHLARSPEDGRGWDVIAPVYLRLGRAEDAARAYRNAIRLLGSTSGREVGLGEAILAAQGGIVTAEARDAFARASVADPTAPAPRFYLALAREQEGDRAGAAADYRALLQKASGDAPWRGVVEQALARVEAPSGPDAAAVAAAAQMSPGERQAMIEGMVSGLAERLQQQPDDVEGWLQLVRAYQVLGRAEDARTAARTALTALSADDRTRVSALAADLGLDLGGPATQ